MCEVCKGLHRYACYMQRLDLIHEVYMVGSAEVSREKRAWMRGREKKEEEGKTKE